MNEINDEGEFWFWQCQTCCNNDVLTSYSQKFYLYIANIFVTPKLF
jgi:hypothetical protein